MTFYKPLSIGNLKLNGNIFLAPMAGYTDRFFRSICLNHGADLAYTEMVSCEGVARDSRKTIDLMERGENERNLAVQLFAPDSKTVSRCIEGVMKFNPQLIDFNCGCPVPKVCKTGAGSALLNKSEEIYRIVKILKEETGLPVTVKIRTGWDLNSLSYLKNADSAFSAGADALCMHARTRSQLYMPTADWKLLKDLKEHFPEKVIIGSGDLFSAQDAVRMFTETGVDAVVFARGAIGNPFVFEQTKAVLNGEEKPEISIIDKKNAIMFHLHGLVNTLGENTACREMRKHVCAYLKGIKNGARVRNKISSALTVNDYESALSEL